MERRRPEIEWRAGRSEAVTSPRGSWTSWFRGYGINRSVTVFFFNIFSSCSAFFSVFSRCVVGGGVAAAVVFVVAGGVDAVFMTSIASKMLKLEDGLDL